jgi:hypothetical protein
LNEKPSQAQLSHRELIEARDRVQRQIEILEAGPLATGVISGWTPSPQFTRLLAELREILDEIENELGHSGSKDA